MLEPLGRAGVDEAVGTSPCIGEVAMSVGMDHVVVQDNEPIASRIDGEVVLMSMRAGTLFGLGAIGSEIWNLIQTPCRVGDICAALARDFDVDAATCERQVLEFLESLVARDLVRVVA